MIVVLLILHGLLAVAPLGAIMHQALAVLSTAPAAANGRWNFFDRFRGAPIIAKTVHRNTLNKSMSSWRTSCESGSCETRSARMR
jgi:hypothetical protein